MVQVKQRIEDAALREQTFARRKHELIRQAMELSILCDCDVQLFVHSARVREPDARAQPSSTQFSSDNAELLIAYVREHPPAERFGVEDYWHKFKASAPRLRCDPSARPRGTAGLPDRGCSECHADYSRPAVCLCVPAGKRGAARRRRSSRAATTAAPRRCEPSSSPS